MTHHNFGPRTTEGPQGETAGSTGTRRRAANNRRREPTPTTDAWRRTDQKGGGDVIVTRYSPLTGLGRGSASLASTAHMTSRQTGSPSLSGGAVEQVRPTQPGRQGRGRHGSGSELQIRFRLPEMRTP